MRAFLIFGLVLCACGGKESEPDPRTRCSLAAKRDVGVLVHRRGAQPDAIDAELEATLTEVCLAERWSAAVTDCFQAEEQMSKCRALMTPEQRGTYARKRGAANAKRVGTVRRGAGSAGSSAGSGHE